MEGDLIDLGGDTSSTSMRIDHDTQSVGELGRDYEGETSADIGKDFVDDGRKYTEGHDDNTSRQQAEAWSLSASSAPDPSTKIKREARSISALLLEANPEMKRQFEKTTGIYTGVEHDDGDNDDDDVSDDCCDAPYDDILNREILTPSLEADVDSERHVAVRSARYIMYKPDIWNIRGIFTIRPNA